MDALRMFLELSKDGRHTPSASWQAGDQSFSGMDKLIEVVAQGLGALARPWMIRRLARAQADRLKILTAAEREIVQQLQLPAPASSITDEIVKSGQEIAKSTASEPGVHLLAGSADSIEQRIEQRIAQRIDQWEIRRQRNLEAIVLSAADAMPESNVSEEPVDSDWVSRFFTSAQDVSDPELQRLWSRLLLREVSEPRSVSMRTLDVVRNLSPVEAQTFQESLRYACEDGGYLFFVVTNDGLPWKVKDSMIDCGLFGANFQMSVRPGERFVFLHGGLKIGLRPLKEEMSFPWCFDVIRLSDSGSAIARISWRPSDFQREFLEGLLDSYAQYFIIEVMQGEDVTPLRELLARTTNSAPP